MRYAADGGESGKSGGSGGNSDDGVSTAGFYGDGGWCWLTFENLLNLKHENESVNVT